MTVISKPASGPAIATSNSICRLTVNPLDVITAPNVGMPYTGIPGIKYGQDVFSLCNLATTRCPDS